MTEAAIDCDGHVSVSTFHRRCEVNGVSLDGFPKETTRTCGGSRLSVVSTYPAEG